MISNIKSKLSILADRKFWLFAGSGLIVSVAYMDPGNWGTNISGGQTLNTSFSGSFGWLQAWQCSSSTFPER